MRALGLVTLTPSSFARATMSILFLDETACAILVTCQHPLATKSTGRNVLGSEGLVVHEEKFNIADVVDQESLVSGWHHVAGLLVGSETNLFNQTISPCPQRCRSQDPWPPVPPCS